MAGPLSIVLNLVFLGEEAAGAGRYVRELVPALLSEEPSNRIVAFVSERVPPSFLAEPWAGEVEWVHTRLGGHARHLATVMLGLPARAARRGLDVLHSPANVGPLLAPRVAKVVTLLDLIPLHQGEGWEAGRRARFAMGTLGLASARRADRVIAISEAAKRDFVETAGLSAEKIDVTPLGVRVDERVEATPEAELRARLDLGPGQVILSVAQKRPYKNLGALVRALPDLEADTRLVLAGSSTAHEDELRALAASLRVSDRVRFTDWLPERDLEGLYRAATCFALPSLIEGFGLPVLEAMARGLPVACSDRYALPEVTGGAAVLFDPEDQGAVTGAMRKLLADEALRSELARKGRGQARLFTWARTARATLDSYRRAVART
ncbi:MAG: glycosyltransferase family 1 protein [Dehalococcoidia bacterium]